MKVNPTNHLSLSLSLSSFSNLPLHPRYLHTFIPLSFIPSKNMAGHRAPISLSLLVAVVLAFAPAEAHNIHKVQHNSLFDLGHVCKDAPFPDECKELIPKLTAQNPSALTQALLQAALSVGQEAEAAAAELLADPATGHSMKMKVEQCKEGYDKIMSSLKTAMEHLISKSGNMNTEVMIGISAATVYAGLCEKIVVQNPELMNSPLHKVNFELGKLVANLSLAIGDKPF